MFEQFTPNVDDLLVVVLHKKPENLKKKNIECGKLNFHPFFDNSLVTHGRAVKIVKILPVFP